MDNSNSPTSYLKALKSKPLKNVTMHASARGQALIDQDQRCQKCKKDIKPYYCKYVQDPATKKYTVLCGDCAVHSGKR